MLRIHDKTGRMISSHSEERVAGLRNAGWFDLLSPTPEDEEHIKAALNIDLPTQNELHDIEPSSRLYNTNDVLYLTMSLAYRSETNSPRITDVGFIIAGDKLVTIRYAELGSFQTFASSIDRAQDCHGGPNILSRLLETIVDHTAEILEYASQRTDQVTLCVFHAEENPRPDRATRDLEATLTEIARLRRLVSKVSDSLICLSRIAGFLQTSSIFKTDDLTESLIHSVNRDVQSLSLHADSVVSNIIFLLDACLGLISVQQNTVMKTFSVAAVVLLPPTFIGTVYGMNFKHMPELEAAWGYPAALSAMALAAILPLLWFRRKGWL